MPNIVLRGSRLSMGVFQRLALTETVTYSRTLSAMTGVRDISPILRSILPRSCYIPLRKMRQSQDQSQRNGSLSFVPNLTDRHWRYTKVLVKICKGIIASVSGRCREFFSFNIGYCDTVNDLGKFIDCPKMMEVNNRMET